jgi:hypothetical protein
LAAKPRHNRWPKGAEDICSATAKVTIGWLDQIAPLRLAVPFSCLGVLAVAEPLSLPIRQNIFSLLQTDLGAADIARQLGLPLRTVSRLVARWQAAAAELPVGGAIDLTALPASGGQPLAQPRRDFRQACLDLRRAHSGWGAGRIRIELCKSSPSSAVPPRAPCSVG